MKGEGKRSNVLHVAKHQFAGEWGLLEISDIDNFPSLHSRTIVSNILSLEICSIAIFIVEEKTEDTEVMKPTWLSHRYERASKPPLTFRPRESNDPSRTIYDGHERDGDVGQRAPRR